MKLQLESSYSSEQRQLSRSVKRTVLWTIYENYYVRLFA